MVVAYEILPTSDPDHCSAEESRPSLTRRCSSALEGACVVFQAHADALDAAWLTELDRLGAPVFACFMLLKIGLLSLAVLWGILLVSPLWCLSLVSNERFLPSALQTGLIVTLIIILEPLPFVALMRDARSKAFHVFFSTLLLLGWREVCVFLVREETLGLFAARQWVRDLCFTFAGAAVLGCGALAWTISEGTPRRLWMLCTGLSLLFLQTVHSRLRTDD